MSAEQVITMSVRDWHAAQDRIRELEAELAQLHREHEDSLDEVDALTAWKAGVETGYKLMRQRGGSPRT